MYLNLLSCYLSEETKVLFTYEVQWVRSEVRWASRWDTYLAMSDVQIHWFSIINSVVVIFFLAGKLFMTNRNSLFRCNIDLTPAYGCMEIWRSYCGRQ